MYQRQVPHSFDIQRSEPVFPPRFCCLHIFFAHQDIKNDPAVVGADEGRVGHIKAAHLIDAITYFKQTGFGVELGIPPQTAALPIDYRNGIDVMTTETTCLSSVWSTDDALKDYLTILGRGDEFAYPKHHVDTEIVCFQRVHPSECVQRRGIKRTVRLSPESPGRVEQDVYKRQALSQWEACSRPPDGFVF